MTLDRARPGTTAYHPKMAQATNTMRLDGFWRWELGNDGMEKAPRHFQFNGGLFRTNLVFLLRQDWHEVVFLPVRFGTMCLFRVRPGRLEHPGTFRREVQGQAENTHQER